MARKIKISADQVQMEAELNESQTASLLWDKLPIKASVNTWGEEIYFEVPVEAEKENAVSVVEEGDIAYWPEGSSFCIFFGQTPMSTPTEIKPASPVSPLGRLLDDPKAWKAIKPGTVIEIKQA